MTTTDYEKSIVALACWRFLGTETYRGMLMVAMVLRNRAEAGWFEGSIYNNATAAMLEAENANYYCPPTDLHVKLAYADDREPEFQKLLQAMDGIFSGSIEDKTGGALYWALLSSEEIIAGERTAQFGKYIFFK
jgi:spore germination cell wall hydrolase CwlJ-like protein